MSYETEEEVNIRLYRYIKSGNEYNSLIPKSDCKRIYGGSGNTLYSVNQMARVVKLYSHHTQKIAQKLKSSSLKSTLQNIQDFVYWHFQYKIDRSDQYLRSPACSWKQRNEGIDCKSYSIIVASILHELGITSYLRRVSYEIGKPYGHVYNVIPKNQTSGSLTEDKNSYYIIDGTLNINIEIDPDFYEKSDIKMETGPLDHYILAKPNLKGLGASNVALSNYERLYIAQRGLGLNRGLGNNGNKFEFLKNIDLNKVGDLFKNFWNLFKNTSCWGGSAYKDVHLARNMAALKSMIDSEIKVINDALSERNYSKMSLEINRFYHKYILFNLVVKSNLSEGWNTCSTKVQEKQIFINENHLYNICKALYQWARESFDYTQNTQTLYFNHPAKSGGHLMGTGPKLEFVNSNAAVNLKVSPDVTLLGKKLPNAYNLVFSGIKANKTITFFEATSEINQMFNSVDSVHFDTDKFLNELKNTATVFFTPTGTSNGNTSGSTGNSNNNTSPQNGNGNTSSVGSSSTMKMAGAGLVLLAIGYGATQFNNNKTKKQ